MDNDSDEFNKSKNETDDTFSIAADHVQRIHRTLSSDTLLSLYALYKQAIFGQCNSEKPSLFQMQERSKWIAWHSLGNMSSEEAQQLYINKVYELDPNWQAEKYKQVGAFASQKTSFGWVVHSVQKKPDDPEACKPEHEKTPLDYVKELNLCRLRDTLKTKDLSTLDEHGMALIHWATDRNATDILKFLLTAGADVNQRDKCQQTPLHYAASCGHVDVLRVLIAHNADPTLRDSDGQSCLDVADDDDVRRFLIK